MLKWLIDKWKCNLTESDCSSKISVQNWSWLGSHLNDWSFATMDYAKCTAKKDQRATKRKSYGLFQRRTNVWCTYSTVNSRMVNMFLYQMGYFPNVVQFLRINCLGSFPFDREIFYSNLLVRVLIPEHEEIGIFHWKWHFQTFSFPIILKSI